MASLLAELGLKFDRKAHDYGLEKVALTPNKGLSIEEQIAVRQACLLDARLSYVLFRRFRDDRPAQPAAYVINNEDDNLAKAEIAEIHRNFWLHGSAPLLYVGWADHVDIFSCSARPEKQAADWKYKPSEVISIISDELIKTKYSASRLLDGTFWDDTSTAKKYSSESEFSHKILLEKVAEFDKELNGACNPGARRLLLQTLLIKYLEDRNVFPKKNPWFAQFKKGARSFLELLQNATKSEFIEMLQALEKKFNGNIFSIDDSDVKEKTLRQLAFLATKNIDTRGQLSFWELYSFEHIPVEIISQIYQRFARKDNGSVYTPNQLVDLILNQVMKLKDIGENTKVLDPTCGSGVFLVSALKRIYHAIQKRNGWKDISAKSYTDILNNSIFGIDSEKDVIDITCFSLALAVCDALRPEVIWSELKFRNLVDKNLFCADCFSSMDTLKTKFPDGFSYIVGNPPFLSDLSSEQKKTLSIKIPDKQLAYAVLWKSSELLSSNGIVAMIQPSGILYNAKTTTFRKKYFDNISVSKVLDFVSIRGLFGAGDTKIVVIIAANMAHEHRDKSISHLTFRRTNNVQQRKVFELDYYDFHVISQDEAKSNDYVWRINLLGGGRLHKFAQRLKEYSTLGEFIKKQEWSLGEGYIAGKNDQDKKPCSWLHKMLLVPTEALTDEGISESLITTVNEDKFKYCSSLERFTAPMILLKESMDLQIGFLPSKYTHVAYKDKIVGITSRRKDEGALRAFFHLIKKNHTILKTSIQLFSTQCLIGKATAILKRDIDSVPWPMDGEWNISEWERILSSDIKYMSDYVRLGQESEILGRNATCDEVARYAQLVCRMLSELYPEIRPGKTLISPSGLSGQVFYFGEDMHSQLIQSFTIENLSSTVYHDSGDSLITVRLLRVYDANAFIMIKPNKFRYWMNSVAIRDADDVLSDLLEQGF